MRTELEKHRNLLGVMLMLLLIKFIVYPILDWQAELASSNSIKQTKASKIELLLNKQQQLKTAEATIQKALAKVEGYFFKSENVAKFKLQQQQTLEQLAQKYQLKISNIGWLPAAQINNQLVSELKVRLDIKGLTENIAQFIFAVEQQQPHINVNKLALNIRAQDDHIMGLSTSHLELQYFILIEQDAGK